MCVCVCFSSLPTLSWPSGQKRKCPAHASSDEYQKSQCTVLSLTAALWLILGVQTHIHFANLKQEVGSMFYFQPHIPAPLHPISSACAVTFQQWQNTEFHIPTPTTTLIPASIVTAPISFRALPGYKAPSVHALSPPPPEVHETSDTAKQDCWPILPSSPDASWRRDVVMTHT